MPTNTFLAGVLSKRLSRDESGCRAGAGDVVWILEPLRTADDRGDDATPCEPACLRLERRSGARHVRAA